MENAPGNLFVTIKLKQSSKPELGTLRDCGKCCYLWERQGLKYSQCSRFNLGSTIGNRNNCVLATGGFLQGGVPYAETRFLYCKWFSSQTLLFPKATFPGLSYVLSFSPSLLLLLLLISFPSLFLLLFWEKICARCLEVLFVSTWWRREEDIKWKTLITRVSYGEIWKKKNKRIGGGEKGVKKGINQTEWSSSTPSEKKNITNSSLVSSQYKENNIAVACCVVSKDYAKIIDRR